MSLARRLAKLETIAAPPPLVPNVLRVRRTETTEDAIRRFAATYPKPPRPCLLIVPERDMTAEDDADFERRFKTQQRQSQADARSANPKDTTI